MEESRSAALFAAAKRVMPGGVNSPVRACSAVGRIPRFIARAYGDRIVDVDGHTYVDYICSWGPGILGHAHPKVVEAVTAACREGLTYGAPTAREVEMAELIRALIPSMEVSRMVSSGTEAVMSAVRVARGFTGRDDILKFEGCYHGHSDGLLVAAGSGVLTQGDSAQRRPTDETPSIPTSAGVPLDYARHTLVAPYNDMDAVARLFAERGDSIAAVVVEPVAANMGVVLPRPGFLRFLREITRKYGALLIFDEVITGFRLSLSGAQAPLPELYAEGPGPVESVIPDLTTLGKIVGGGLPAAVYGGREELMRSVAPEGKVYQAGTLSGNPIATAAGLATLKLLKADPGLYARLAARTRGLAEAARAVWGEKAEVVQVGSLMSVHLGDAVSSAVDAAEAAALFARWYSHLLENGIYVAPSRFEAMFVSAAHTEADLARTCEVMRGFTP